MLIEGASPVYVEASLPEAADGRLSVLAAVSGKQLASWDREARHGSSPTTCSMLFTERGIGTRTAG